MQEMWKLIQDGKWSWIYEQAYDNGIAAMTNKWATLFVCLRIKLISKFYVEQREALRMLKLILRYAKIEKEMNEPFS